MRLKWIARYFIIGGARLSERVAAMKEADEEEKMLRRYLLGELDEDERERVEERFITDGDFKERALMTEGELVDEYLAGELSEAEKELFVGHFLSTPGQQRKLRITASLKRHVAAETPIPPPPPGGEGLLPGDVEGVIQAVPFWRNPWVVGGASLALLLAVIFGSLWLNGVRRERQRLAGVQKELQQVNAEPASDGAPAVFLAPVALRGGDRSSTLSPRADGGTVQLWLVLVRDEYPSYQVVFRKDGDADRFTVDGLRAETSPRGRAISFRLPSHLLSPGLYVLTLNGVADGGRTEAVGEYSFEATP
jgi:hypothetical protein